MSTKAPKMAYADGLVVGMWIIPPGKKRPVQIVYQNSNPENASYFEFAASSPQGGSAIVLHRSQQVEVVTR